VKITINKTYNHYWKYNINNIWKHYNQEQHDYIFKYLGFDKIDKYWPIHFSNKETKEWFYKIYTDTNYLEDVYKESPLGYEWLSENWGKDIFNLIIWYSDKQEFKTIVNKIINVELIRR